VGSTDSAVGQPVQKCRRAPIVPMPPAAHNWFSLLTLAPSGTGCRPYGQVPGDCTPAFQLIGQRARLSCSYRNSPSRHSRLICAGRPPDRCRSLNRTKSAFGADWVPLGRPGSNTFGDNRLRGVWPPVPALLPGSNARRAAARAGHRLAGHAAAPCGASPSRMAPPAARSSRRQPAVTAYRKHWGAKVRTCTVATLVSESRRSMTGSRSASSVTTVLWS
jgi:hypothetical protein